MVTFSPDQLITEIIDTVAQRKPDSAWLAWLTSEQKDTSHLKTITYGTLSIAVNRVAWIIHNNVRKRAEFESITYLGPSDARYAIVLYACVKAGYKVLFTSPRNSLDAHLKLIAACDCKTLITPLPSSDQAREIVGGSGIEVVHLPSLDELCAGASSGLERPFPFSKTWSEAKHDPFVILHTSGTTGHPRPIVFTHEYFSRCVKANNWPAPQGCSSLNSLFSPPRIISLMPLFHVAGVFHVSILPLYAQNVTILPPPGTPPTSNTLVSILEQTLADSAAISPATVDCLARNPDALDFVEKRLQRLFYMGGVPTQALAELVARRIELLSGIGSSECGPYVQLIPEGKESSDQLWPYIQLNPYMNGRFEAQSSELYELVLQRNSPEEEQAIFLLFPEQTEYRTKDVFSPHPTVPDLWSYRGRVDDIIVFSHGEKFNPVSFESQLCGHPDITGALVFGSGHFEAGLLIELNVLHDAGADAAPVTGSNTDKIWQAVQAANNTCPDFAIVARSHIIYTSPSKRMLRTGKGTIRRHATLNLYQEEISHLYREANRVTSSDQLDDGLPKDRDALAQYLVHAIETVTGKRISSMDTSMFETGMNSLQITRLTHHLQQLKGLDGLKSSLLYSHPTLASLTEAILAMLGQGGHDIHPASLDKKFTFKQALKEYSGKIDGLTHTLANVETLSEAECNSNVLMRPIVILTGSTGGVGSYILERLLNHPSQPHVYCLNRSANAAHRQSLQNKQRDPTLTASFPPERVTFLHADLASDRHMGLEDNTFKRLLATVSLVIHNAWPVDFTQPLSFFKPSLDGVLNLISFCRHAKCSPRLLFVSSVAVAKNQGLSIVPEAPIQDATAAMSGYGESKLLAELMLDRAAQAYRSEIAIARVGQVAGAATTPGVWNSRDWLPRLVMTSRQLQMVPDELGVDNDIDWVPIDQVADILVELSLVLKAQPALKVFHVVNSNRITWKELLPVVVTTLQESMPEPHYVQIVTRQDWTEALREIVASMAGGDGVLEQKYPAAPLIDFFEERFLTQTPGLLWETEGTFSASKRMSDLKAIQVEWMRRWTRQWFQIDN